MPAKRWPEIERLFELALERAPADRDHWLRERCRDDPALAAEVASLLAADAEVAAVTGEDERIVAELGTRVVEGAEGRYRIEGRLGTGGTSAVYLASKMPDASEPARAASAGRVAVKVLRGDGNPLLAERFALEARVLCRLDHPGIARFVDTGLTGRGRPFVVTAYVEGEPIDRYCARLSLSLTARLELFVAVCEAVHEAHRNLIIHRDLKPGNVLVDGAGRPVLLDFGLARQLTAPGGCETDAAPTETAGRMLTPNAASPEQIRGEPLTTATDVWGLGVLLYHLLAGRAPFSAWHDRPELLARAICERDPPAPSRAAADGAPAAGPTRWWRQLRGDLDAVAAMALRKRPSHRYASVEQLADDVRRHLDGRPVRARRAGWLYRVGKSVRRHRFAAVTAAALAAGLLVALVTAVVQERRMARERDRTESSFAFLVDILAAVDPGQGGGDAVTTREILDRGLQRIDDELADQPDLAARMLDAVGSVYLALGVVEQAESSLERAVALRRELADGGASLASADSLEHLGVLRQEQGRPADAETLFRDALSQRTHILGERALPVAVSLGKLADSVRDQARYDEAEALYEQSLALLRSHLGEEHETVAEALNNFGLLRHEKGDAQGAEALYRRALGIQRQHYANDHSELASTLHNLASVLRQRGAYEEAAELFDRALAMSVRLYGSESTHVGWTVQNIGMLHLDQGAYEAAKSAFERVIAIDRLSLGDGHSNVATNIHHLGLTAMRSGDLPLAERHFRDAIVRYEQSLGDVDHPWIAFPLFGLGLTLVWDCRLAEAEPLLARSRRIRAEALGADHWRVAEVENVQGLAFARSGSRHQALPLLIRSLAALSQQLPEDDRRVLKAVERLRAAEADELPSACSKGGPW